MGEDPDVSDIGGRGLFRAVELVAEREKAEGMAGGLVGLPSARAEQAGPNGERTRCGAHVLPPLPSGALGRG